MSPFFMLDIYDLKNTLLLHDRILHDFILDSCLSIFLHVKIQMSCMHLMQEGLNSNRTLDLASSLEVGCGTNRNSGETSPSDCSLRSVLTIAFQFPYEVHLQESVAAMARQYVRTIVSSVQRVAMAISPSRLGSNVGDKLLAGTPEAVTLSRWICQSYNYHFGINLLKSNGEEGDPLLKLLWQHQDAILCCSMKVPPVFTFANQAGLDMLETTLVALQDISLERIFDDSGRKVLYSESAKLMEQGYLYLPAGVCLSGMGRQVSYEQAVAWKVMGEDNDLHCLAFCFINWSFV